jgi:hypothetical protein
VQRDPALLGEELGIEPGPALRQLEADVLAQDPALQLPPSSPSSAPTADTLTAHGPDPPGNLPRRRSSFVGRRREVAEVSELTKPGELVTVIGPGGVGKTRLVIEVARRLQASYADGVWFVDLAAVGNPSIVHAAVASVLGIRDEPGRPLIETLIATLKHRQMLLVLDNCEHLLGGVAQVADAILSASGLIAILATSREPVGIEGETVRRIAPLELPPVTICRLRS